MTDETLLHRQVHPSFFSGDRPTSQAFTPTAKDAGKLSVDDGDQFSAEQSYVHYTATLKLESRGVLSVTVSECKALSLAATLDGVPYPEHAFIDMTALSGGQASAKAKKLRDVGLKRDWTFGVLPAPAKP
jgi:hypothetical protein